eukprot:CAMPEP_0119434452 /NCGR_PEP_ID=MMETSP1335-20130426/50676_1 /TAXON_ID=259385 /ORGANISM="Chrysoculter rhomboideus, Strain RCC1486" /LENGTH=312 /DNA_ID=CAMNT_0007460307 /DNA_START=404 /DNA_END=1346 /DNA_ORIENTATION=-
MNSDHIHKDKARGCWVLGAGCWVRGAVERLQCLMQQSAAGYAWLAQMRIEPLVDPVPRLLCRSLASGCPSIARSRASTLAITFAVQNDTSSITSALMSCACRPFIDIDSSVGARNGVDANNQVMLVVTIIGPKLASRVWRAVACDQLPLTYQCLMQQSAAGYAWLAQMRIEPLVDPVPRLLCHSLASGCLSIVRSRELASRVWRAVACDQLPLTYALCRAARRSSSVVAKAGSFVELSSVGGSDEPQASVCPDALDAHTVQGVEREERPSASDIVAHREIISRGSGMVQGHDSISAAACVPQAPPLLNMRWV